MQDAIQTQNNVDKIIQVIRAFNKRDIDFIEKSVTPNFVRHDLADAFLVKYTGSAEVTNFLQSLFTAFPDIQIEILDKIAAADRVVIRYELTGTQRGELFGKAASGQKVSFAGINIYRFENGKIAEVWQLWDWASVLQQTAIINL
jgi:steroid delta-isomerase-like uncharacterized protein